LFIKEICWLRKRLDNIPPQFLSSLTPLFSPPTASPTYHPKLHMHVHKMEFQEFIEPPHEFSTISLELSHPSPFQNPFQEMYLSEELKHCMCNMEVYYASPIQALLTKV
jgi:hypothetical protein